MATKKKNDWGHMPIAPSEHKKAYAKPKKVWADCKACGLPFLSIAVETNVCPDCKHS